MNDLDYVRDLRRDLPLADDATLERIRSGLVREAHRPAHRTRRLWRFAAVPSLAAAAVATVLVLAAAPWTASRDEPVAAPPRSAAEVLAGAALAAQQGMAVRPDQFIFVESIQVDTPGTAGMSRRIWLSADGRRAGLLHVQPRGSKSGWWQTSLEDCPGGVWRTARQGTPIACERSATGGADRSAAPADATAMEGYLRDRGGDVFTAARDLLRDSYLRPESQVALFQVLGRQPGVTADDGVTDAAGRRGVSVGVSRDGVRTELVFDATTYKYLGERVVRGEQVVRESAQLRVAIVDRPGQLP
ncbi:CU044_5270 family protein [Phytohabitans sp. LJ34]|uniref:CU044_5270 family protein n=1 Tax=Phytohabitans sp. LJ34 TaxID=3452217 RepID=UPI003F8956FD